MMIGWSGLRFGVKGGLWGLDENGNKWENIKAGVILLLWELVGPEKIG